MHPIFRLNPAVDVVPWGALADDERQHLRQLLRDTAIDGIVRPRIGESGTIKAVDAATVALLESCRAGAQLAECESIASLPVFLERLVLDGVLQIGIEGGFVSGTSAIAVLGVQDIAEPVHRIAALSVESLRYAEALPIADPRILSARLYTFNSVPFAETWRSTFDDPDGIRELLGVGRSGTNAAALAAGGYEDVEHDQWFAWTRAGVVRDGVLSELPFKLYVSPRPECVADVFSRAIPVLIRHAAGSLKIGRTAQNLLRPDKLVVYFDSEPAMRAAAADLEAPLGAWPAQGVPFTCGIDPAGMLSWGADPPRSLAFAGWAQAESWRACIADYLALGLVQARAQRHPEPWRFALRKVAVEGVDTARWAPRARPRGAPDAGGE